MMKEMDRSGDIVPFPSSQPIADLNPLIALELNNV